MNIQTPFINAVHKGTEFLVTVDDQQTRISVFDGQVAAENKAGRIQINKGFSGIAQKNRPPRLEALTITPEDAVQWALYYPPIIDYQNRKSSLFTPGLKSALAAYQQGDVYQALARLDEVPVTDQDSEYLTLNASLLLTVGRVDEAQNNIDRALQIQHDHSTVVALQSIIAVAKNRQQTALNLALKAAALNPKSSVAQIALSYAYQSLFKIEAALIATQQATRLSPENALAWARLSELQLSTGDRDGALVSAQKARNINPKLARTQTILGFANLARVDIDAAKSAFEQAIIFDSSDPLARLGLGLAKIRKGDLEEGTKDLETAVNLDPDNAVNRSYLGKAYYESRNKDYAGTELNLAKEMDPKDPTPWFYDAILKQTTNRPVEALHDMQKAIELNDNRGVYRSRLLLDKDVAAREAGLGRIYNSLGFDDVANRQAAHALATDPSNYSAHRLLSDSYATKPRHEIARASEQLQAKLLQPLNYNPIQPRLAYIDLNIIKGVGPAETAFNEYSRLFEGNGIHLTTTGNYGSNNTIGDETVLSGIHGKLSYSFGQLHYDTDGYRGNNDLKHNIYNAFIQYEDSPVFSLQTEYRHRDTTHGDLELKGSVSDFANKDRRNLDTDSYRLGFKVSPAEHSALLFSFIYSFRDELNKKFNPIPPIPISPFSMGGELSITDKVENQGYQIESQYLFHKENYDFILGGGDYEFDVNRNTQTIACATNSAFCQNVPQQNTDFSRKQRFGYLYSNINILKNLTSTFGLSYDNYSDNEKDHSINLSQLSPKLGINWKYNNFLSLRLAAFQGVKTPIIVNQILQPTQLAGFNQYFDDLNGTRSTQYGAGIDTHFISSLYTGIEAYKRELNVPLDQAFIKKEEELYRFYLNWIPSNNWAVNTELRFENYRGLGQDKPNSVETAYIPLNLRYFHPNGFFSTIGGTYINQKVKTIEFNRESFNSSFFLLDAAIGYKFPKQFGMISIEANNLLDKQFKYRDRNFQMNEQRAPDFIPERILLGRITVNF